MIGTTIRPHHHISSLGATMSTSDTKICPHCDEEIRAAARKCRHCGELLEDDDEPAAVPRKKKKKATHGTVDRMLIPVGRPVSAIAAGYCALFGVIPGCGLPFSIAALVCGIFALKAIKKDPDLSGSGRAWFGVILGGLMTAVSLIVLVIILVAAASEASRRA
jgi:hypothetical protein